MQAIQQLTNGPYSSTYGLLNAACSSYSAPIPSEGTGTSVSLHEHHNNNVARCLMNRVHSDDIYMSIP